MASTSGGRHRPQKYQDEPRERAVRMVQEVRREGGESYGVITRVARELGVGAESLRGWVNLAEIDSGNGRERRRSTPNGSRSSSGRTRSCAGRPTFLNAAQHLGLAADHAVLQHLTVVLESANPPAVRQFWQRVLDYAPGEDGGLADPLRRDPARRIRQSTETRPRRNRIHLDVVRPAAAVEQAGLGEASGPIGVYHTDPEGNEVVIVSGA